MKAMKFSPLTYFIGKSATAVSMAKYYNAACLNIDSVVLEAISDGSNISGLRARELCIRAAIEQSMKEEESGKSRSPCVFMVKRPAPHYCSWESSLCPRLSFSPTAQLKADLHHAADLGAWRRIFFAKQLRLPRLPSAGTRAALQGKGQRIRRGPHRGFYFGGKRNVGQFPLYGRSSCSVL